MTIEGSVWHTTYHIVCEIDVDPSSAILNALNEVDKSLSAFNDESTVALINRNVTNQCDSLFAQIFLLSQKINSISNGAFDPTVAPLVNLWGFGYEKFNHEPTNQEIDSCLKYVGINDCSLQDLTVIKKKPSTQFDFSAIAKGYGVDRVGDALRALGCKNFMVEIGGEVLVAGLNPEGEKWAIGIDAPRLDAAVGEQFTKVLHLTDCAVATSGNYRNYRNTASGRVGHTISSKTGRPADSNFLSATVIAPTCAEADALATALMAMPDDKIDSMFNALGDKYSFITFVELYSPDKAGPDDSGDRTIKFMTSNSKINFY